MFSRVVRQTHMYTGLVLLPWMLMYGLSTLVMNHRAFFRQLYGGELVRWVPEGEQQYPAQFSPNVPPDFVAEQVLRHLKLEGNYSVRTGKLTAGTRYTILRTDPITPRRISFTPHDSRLVIERQEFRSQPFLESLHRRRGYTNLHAPLDRAWAFSVDVAIVGMILWIASGLWMWWELKVTRRLGFYCVLAGAALFALFVVVL